MDTARAAESFRDLLLRHRGRMGLTQLELAGRVGAWTAQHTQATVQTLLAEEQGVTWSVTTLRQVAAELSRGVQPLTQAAQVAYLLEQLKKAQARKAPELDGG